MHIAIPSKDPGALGAERSAHFGHCDLFTIVCFDQKLQHSDITTLNNLAHQAGGCLAPVALLAQAGIDAIVVAGMGARPMQGFAEAGITVYFASIDQYPLVDDVIEAFKTQKLPIMHPDQSCKGSGNCSH